MNEPGLPLFLHVTDPRAVVVVNDCLIENEVSGLVIQPPDVALRFLRTMYKHEGYRQQIPECFVEIMGDATLYTETGLSNCLVGHDDTFEPMVNWFCLDASLELGGSDHSYLHLKDLKYLGEPLSGESVRLSSIDAFHLLANICTEYLKGSVELGSDIAVKVTPEFHATKLSDNIVPSKSFVEFVSMYIQYLSDRLKAKSMVPFDILKLGGVAPLFFLCEQHEVMFFIKQVVADLSANIDELTKTQKILYVTFLDCIFKDIHWSSYKEWFPMMYSYAEENQDILDHITFHPLYSYYDKDLVPKIKRDKRL